MIMETTMKRFPIGIQTFDKLVEGGYLYIDKTAFVHEIASKYQYVFLSRPRRFGKSLLSSTFHRYFEGRKELFEGLAAGKAKTDWKKHPVFHFDLSTAKHVNEKQLLEELDRKLYGYEQIYGRGKKDINVNQRLEGLVTRSYEQTGERAVLIFDEYDAPLLDVMNDKVRLPSLRQIMRNFYSPIKSLDPYLRFVFITGINKFAQLSIFSELNNLQNISMMPEYSAICGISQSEMENGMKEQIQALADKQKISYDDALALLKENYDGYHFCNDSEDIYNPFSLIKSLNEKHFGSYWFDSATPTHLVERLRRNPMDETTLDRITLVPQSDFDVSPELSDSSLPMLYQTGYLTIKEYDERMQLYTLGYPNKEVKIGFTRGLLGKYPSKTGSASGFVAHFYAAMDSGNIDLAMEKLKAYLAGIPYDLENKTEKHFQTIIYLIFSLLGFHIRTEVKSAIGRADAVCHTDNSVYVFKFKVDGSAEEALRQIDGKGYMIPYTAEPQANGIPEAAGKARRLVKVGVNISSKTRTVEKWISACMD